MRACISGLALAIACAGASADSSADFESPAYSTGILTGQNGWYLPAAGGVDFNVAQYGSDPFGFAVNPTGVPWLATAGAGDVLAGLIGALAAAGLSAHDAARVGAWLHGAAATVAGAGGPLVASGVADALPEVIRGLGPGGD